MLYAIKNRRTGRLITGSMPNGRQIMDAEEPPLLINSCILDEELKIRKISKKTYIPIEVKVAEIKDYTP